MMACCQDFKCEFVFLWQGSVRDSHLKANDRNSSSKSIQFILCRPKSQITNLPQSALQSVHIRHPWPLTSHRIRENSQTTLHGEKKREERGEGGASAAPWHQAQPGPIDPTRREVRRTLRRTSHLSLHGQVTTHKISPQKQRNNGRLSFVIVTRPRRTSRCPFCSRYLLWPTCTKPIKDPRKKGVPLQMECDFEYPPPHTHTHTHTLNLKRRRQICFVAKALISSAFMPRSGSHL